MTLRLQKSAVILLSKGHRGYYLVRIEQFYPYTHRNAETGGKEA